MEFLRGQTLAERLRDSGRMSAQESLPLVRQMASALDAAHDAGVVHRDFKPSNVMLIRSDQGAEERAVVADFGLAMHTEGASTAASWITGSRVMGSPAYMAPEQFDGHSTPASDIYAFGLVIYEMVTGARPFEGTTPITVAVKRLTEPPRPPRKLCPELPLQWEEVILRCLERDPTKRFASAHDVAEALTLKSAERRRLARRLTVAWLVLLLLIGAFTAYRFVGRPYVSRHLSASLPSSSAPTVSSAPIPSSAHANVVYLPLSWGSISAIEPAGDAVYLGGSGSGGAMLGMLHIDSRIFSDVMSAFPSYWSRVETLAYGDNQLLLTGRRGLSGGCCVTVFSPASGEFRDITFQLRGSSPAQFKYPGIRAAYNGDSFLLGGAGDDTSLRMYLPATGTFMSVSVPSYFAVNTITTAGNSFLIAGAGPGASSAQPPAMGIVSSTGAFADLTGALPPDWGRSLRSAYDGTKFLVQGLDRTTGLTQRLAIFDPAGHRATDVTSAFPAAFNLHCVAGGNGYFLLGGQLAGEAYLARYRPGQQPIDLTRMLPEQPLDVTAVKIVGEKEIVGGVTKTGQVFIQVMQ